jgi:hypothetical protein
VFVHPKCVKAYYFFCLTATLAFISKMVSSPVFPTPKFHSNTSTSMSLKCETQVCWQKKSGHCRGIFEKVSTRKHLFIFRFCSLLFSERFNILLTAKDFIDKQFQPESLASFFAVLLLVLHGYDKYFRAKIKALLTLVLHSASQIFVKYPFYPQVQNRFLNARKKKLK